MSIIIYMLCFEAYATHALLFPPNSVLQMMGSISVPVTDLSPQRRVVFDWGFQVNYDLPFDVASFYSTPIWTATDNSTARTIRNVLITRRNAGVHSRDYSLIEIYKAMEEILDSAGFHSSCLLLDICDLVRFPFDERMQHILADLLSYFLRPTKHLTYISEQIKIFENYLKAEIHGVIGLDCRKVYAKCPANFLDLFSKVVYNE